MWRALRYVYSVERNRKVFKRLFPPDLFAAFIDVGHYESDIEHYQELDRRFRQLSTAGVSCTTAACQCLGCSLIWNTNQSVHSQTDRREVQCHAHLGDRKQSGAPLCVSVGSR